MNIGLPFLEQIRAAGRKTFTSSPQSGTFVQTGAELGGGTQVSPDDSGWGWIALTFSQIVAAITTGYHVEHNTDDSHKIIHASGAIYERDRTTAIGDWTDVAFSAANYSGAASMTWTVTLAQQVVLSYLRLGTTLYLNYWIEGATLGGTASASLKITLPANLVVAQYATAPVHYVNSTSNSGFVTATPGDRFLEIKKTDASNWNTAATVTVHGQIALKVSDSSDVGVTVVDPVVTYTGGSRNFAASTALALTTAGTYTMTVNRAMTLTLKASAGGGGASAGGNTGGGAGGGGGATSTGTTVSLVTGKTYTLVIGAAGAGGTTGDGGNGSSTTFVNTTDTVTLLSLAGGAKGSGTTGGAGGALVTGSNGVTGGTGGNSASPGQVGGAAASGCGGGGGGAFGTTFAGGNGGNGSATAGTGGAAGSAGTNNGGLAGGGGASAGGAGGGGGGGGGAQFTGSSSAFGGGGGGGGVIAASNTTGGAGLAGGAVFTFVSAP